MRLLSGAWDIIEPMAGPLLARIGIYSMAELLAALIIFGLIACFAVQIFAWMTPPNPAYGHAVALGIGVGILGYIFVTWKAHLIPTVLGACMAGVYDWQGYIYVLSVLALLIVFAVNIGTSWRENRPLEVFR